MANNEKQVKLVVKKAVRLILRLLVAVSDFKLYTHTMHKNQQAQITTYKQQYNLFQSPFVCPTGIIKTPKADVIFQFSAKIFR